MINSNDPKRPHNGIAHGNEKGGTEAVNSVPPFSSSLPLPLLTKWCLNLRDTNHDAT